MLDPSSWVVRFAALLKPGGRVLDLACGNGRHSILLAGLGFDVLGVDLKPDTLALARLSAIGLKENAPQFLESDLEGPAWPLPSAIYGHWDGIIVTNYLYRPFLTLLPSLLNANGLLIYETFALGNAQFGKPASPEFLLMPGELLQLAEQTGLLVLAFEDLFTAQPKPAMVQRLCAQKPA
ncbi:MAG: methyltransferase domain-containing protein [Burkholderiales bacterium]|nr:methyltransferase domain-containing protein [Burkholderiales bacterium]